MVLLRMVFQPGPNEVVDLRFGILLALIGAAIVAYGGWQSMQEEGTTFDDARDQLRTTIGDVRRTAAGAGRSPPARRATSRRPSRSDAPAPERRDRRRDAAAVDRHSIPARRFV